MQKSIPASLLVCGFGTAALLLLQCATLLFFSDVSGTRGDMPLHVLLAVSIVTPVVVVLFSRLLKDLYFRHMQKVGFLIGLGIAFLLALILQFAAETGWRDEWLQLSFLLSSLLISGVFANLVLLWGGLWGTMFFATDDKRMCFYVLCCSFILGLGSFGLVLYTDMGKRSVAFLLLASMAFAIGFSLLVMSSLPRVEKTWAESRSGDPLATMLRLRPYTAGFAFAAFSVFFICRMGFKETAFWFVAGGLFCLSALVLGTAARKEIPSFFIEPWMFFVAETTMVIAYMFPPNSIVTAIFGGAFAVYYVMYLSAVNITAAKNRLNPYVHFSMRIYRPMFGVALGLCVGVLAVTLLPDNLCFSVVTLLSFLAIRLNHMRDPYYWQEWASLYRYANDQDDPLETAKLGVRALDVVKWEDTCRNIAAGFDLSERETDVFILLAKGRNAALIAEKLFISANTARTHIYRIYSKTGLKNQQNLISLVEEEQYKRKSKMGSQAE